ncbi:MAG: disulfide bond formation protein B [Gammaproteobacteria bacterium]|nr:disulfide bond formation protein B [Gammaproteobacteria bacterium]
MTLPSRRWINAGGFVACAGMMAYALYAQYQLYLDPCPLCLLQRVAVIGMGVVFLFAALHNPRGIGRPVYSGLLGLFAIGGVVVAGRHVWLQNLPPDKVPSCGPGLGYMLDNFPLGDAVRMVFTGSGECATVDWSFLGLSMPAWVLIAILALGTAGIWNNLRKPA